MTQYTNVLDIVLHVFKIQNYNIMKYSNRSVVIVEYEQISLVFCFQEV